MLKQTPVPETSPEAAADGGSSCWEREKPSQLFTAAMVDG
jgi:hypothetical protein